MARFEKYGELDEAAQIDGDVGWKGVNMRLEPHLLEKGYAAEAQNMRFDHGVAETRLGIVNMPWGSKITAADSISITRSGTTATWTSLAHGFFSGQTVTITGALPSEYSGTFVITVTSPTVFTYVMASDPGTSATQQGHAQAQGTVAFGTIYGTGVFSDPVTKREYVIIAADGKVYYTSPNNVPILMPVPPGVSVVLPCTFTQAFNVLFLHQDETQDTLQLTNVFGSWTTVPQTTSGTGTLTIPKVKRSLFQNNRLFLPQSDDTVSVSDFGDYTRYLPALQDFRVAQGSADKLVSIHKFNDVTLIAFKDHSIYAIYNVYGNLAATQQDQITGLFGLIAPESVAHVGPDLWFLSELGVMSLRQTEFNKIQGVVLPVSDPIQPLINRINWRYAGNAQAAYWNNRYYLAVPLDDAEIIGPDLVGTLLTTDASNNSVLTGLIAGQMYRWTPNVTAGSSDLSLTNGTQVITLVSSGAQSPIDFVAQGTTVTLKTLTVNFVGGTVQRVSKGVNNSVLVYDFLNGAWSGQDIGAGISVIRWIQTKYNGKQRLFFIGSDGFLRLYEEGYEDDMAVPFTEVRVTATPAVGNTIQVNSGTLVTAANAIGNTAPSTWGADNRPDAASNLFSNLVVSGYGGPVQVFTAPNTTVTGFIDGSGNLDNLTGFQATRFYSTNGLIPNVVTTGTWAKITQVNIAQITSYIVTRGYQAPQKELLQSLWFGFDVQSWNPNYSLILIAQGANAQFTHINQTTKDRGIFFRPFDRPRQDLTNINGDWNDKYSLDYSLALGNDGAVQTSPSIRLDTTPGGIRLDLHQEIRETAKVQRIYGRMIQGKIINITGRVRVIASRLEFGVEQTRAGSYV